MNGRHGKEQEQEDRKWWLLAHLQTRGGLLVDKNVVYINTHTSKTNTLVLGGHE